MERGEDLSGAVGPYPDDIQEPGKKCAVSNHFGLRTRDVRDGMVPTTYISTSGDVISPRRTSHFAS
jgi:hypothetical protein